MTLSNREKLLLFILGLVAIIVVTVILIILPMNQAINSLKLEKVDLESQKLVIDTTLPRLPSLKTTQEARVETLDEELSRIESPITGAEFERWMLPLTTKYDMQITDLAISEQVVSEPNGNVVLVNEPIYGLKTAIQGFTGDMDELDTTPVSSDTLLMMNVKYDMVTNYPRFKSLLSDISRWNTTFYVSGADYNFTNGVASVSIDAYMIHKLNYDGDRSYTGDYHASGDNDTGGDPSFIDDVYYK